MTEGDEQPRPAKPGIKRTRYAKEGVDFAVLFAAKFLNVKVNGHTPVLAAPEGVSTGGGAQALQHITLAPALDGEPAHTVGWVNCVNKSAKLRTFECVQQLYRMRPGAKHFGLTSVEYQDFFDRTLVFLKQRQLQVDIETRPPQVEQSSRLASRAATSDRRGKIVKIWATIATLLLLAALIYLALNADVLF